MMKARVKRSINLVTEFVFFILFTFLFCFCIKKDISMGISIGLEVESFLGDLARLFCFI